MMQLMVARINNIEVSIIAAGGAPSLERVSN